MLRKRYTHYTPWDGHGSGGGHFCTVWRSMYWFAKNGRNIRLSPWRFWCLRSTWCYKRRWKGTLNPNWHELRKQKKMLIFSATKEQVLWAWQGVKLIRLMSIFTSKKVSKFLIQIQLTKFNPKITRGVKVPCHMPIRVNEEFIEST